MVFWILAMRFSLQFNFRSTRAVLLIALAAAAGCQAVSYAGYKSYAAAGGGSDYAIGEEHEVDLPAQDAFVMAQDVLRGEGVLFDAKPDEKIETYWRDADHPASMVGSVFGVHPKYRYEIEVVPEGERRSKIIVNVRAEDIPTDQIENYKATRKLDFFNQFDKVAATFPPAPKTPGAGGVNYALLPGEDLLGLAKRVTGNADNWHQIAKDNGLKSATDTAGVQSIWVAQQLIKTATKSPPASPSKD